jgi:hypothetical protein
MQHNRATVRIVLVVVAVLALVAVGLYMLGTTPFGAHNTRDWVGAGFLAAALGLAAGLL